MMMQSKLLFVVIFAWSACQAGTVTADDSEQLDVTYPEFVSRLYDLKRLAEPLVDERRSGNFSSYDRKAKYDATTDDYLDWHANRDGTGYIRKEGDGIVALELNEPGVIWRVWSASAEDGHIQIFIDGEDEPTLDMPFKEYFNNKSGLFAYPELVQTMSRGHNNFVPISFQKSCKIVLQEGWGEYYQFTCTKIYNYFKIPSFRGEFNEEERAALQKANDAFAARGKDPKPPVANTEIVNKTITIEPHGSVDVCELLGPRAISQFHVVPDPNDEQPIRTLRELTLAMTWDDGFEPAVWAPLGDFFGTAPGINFFRSLPTGMTKEGFYAYWFMPFVESARVTIANDGSQPRTLTVRIHHHPITPDDRWFRFHAKWHRDHYVGVDEHAFRYGDRWPDWPMLVANGRGRFVGVNLHVWNPNPFGKFNSELKIDRSKYSSSILKVMRNAADDWWWGEGDEKFFVDDETFPSTFGTGSEDYFGYAWAAENPVEFESALQNQPLNKNSSLGHVSNSRFQLADAIPFRDKFEASIEKYHPNSWPLLYACTAYWYQLPFEKDFYDPVPVEDRVDYYVEP